jgi:hypothetical protein
MERNSKHGPAEEGLVPIIEENVFPASITTKQQYVLTLPT